MLRRSWSASFSTLSKKKYGDWATGSAPKANLDGKLSIDVFGAYADEYDVYRPHYPTEMWNDLLQDRGPLSSHSGVAADIAAGTGRGAIELARLGFHSTAVDLDPGMLEQISHVASKEGLAIDTLHAPAENTTLPADSVDLLVSLQAFHWFDALAATEEFYRILNKPNGLVLVAWNDRDLDVQWIKELEDIIEKYNPLYNRTLKIAESVVENGDLFERSGHFTVDSLRFYANPVIMNQKSLISLLWTFSYVRNAFGKDLEKSRLFEKEVEDLIFRHHGHNEFELPWICKSYILRPTN